MRRRRRHPADRPTELLSDCDRASGRRFRNSAACSGVIKTPDPQALVVAEVCSATLSAVAPLRNLDEKPTSATSASTAADER